MNPLSGKSIEASHVWTYKIPYVVDAGSLELQARAGGNLNSANSAGWMHLARQVSHTPPGSVVVTLLYVFDPAGDGRDRQSRLRPYLCIEAFDPAIANTMRVLVERGPLSGLYKFEKIDGSVPLPEGLQARCEVVRCRDVIPASRSCEFNPRVPPAYQVVRPFVPSQRDSWILDRVLDRVDEPVVFKCSIQAVDTSSDLRVVTALMDRYHSVNHGRDVESEDELGVVGIEGLPQFRRFDSLPLLNLKDPLADPAWHGWRPVHEALCHESHLWFAIEAWAKTEAVARLVGGVVAESDFDGGYRLQTAGLRRDRPQRTGDAIDASSSQPSADTNVTCSEDNADPEGQHRLTRIATVEELSGTFKMPVDGPDSMTVCLRRNTDPPYEDPRDLFIVGFDNQGIEDNPHPVARGLTTEDVRKHLTFCAGSGAGKTTAVIHLLIQFYEKGIPFIVFETSKRELRIIKALKKHRLDRVRKLARKLQVFTVGNEDCSPLRLNPLEVLAGMDPAVHTDRCLENLLASMPIFPALPGILGEALERMYEGKSASDRPPVIYELYGESSAVLAAKDYRGEVHSNLGAALDVRLGDLTRRVAGGVFKCRHSVPSIPHLMSSHSIIEMDRLGQNPKAVLTLCLLTAIWEQLSLMPPAKGLRLVILIEECHNIFSPSGPAKASEEAADPTAFVVALIKRLLVELRALGVGIILVDQHPTNVDRATIKCTGAKTIGKQPDGEDHEILRQSVLLSQAQAEDLARLKPGNFYFIKEGYYRPLRIKTPNLCRELDLPPFPTDDELRHLIQNELWFREMARQRTELELGQLKEAMDRFDRAREAVAGHVLQLLKVYDLLLREQHSLLKRQRLGVMARRLRGLREALLSAQKEFEAGPYRLFSGLIKDPSAVGQGMETLADSLRRRFQTVAQAQTHGLLNVIDNVAKNCSKHIITEMNYDQKHGKAHPQ